MRFIEIVLGLIVILIAATLLVRCAASHGHDDYQTTTHIEQQIVKRVNACLLSETEIISRFEQQGVDETWAKEAATLAQTDRRFMMMAHRSDELGREGSEVTNKLIKLAVSDPEAIDYVLDFIDMYPQEEAEPFTDDVTKGVVPQLYQWDERWAFIEYSGTTFGCTGCGPTSMSMVYTGLTGKTDKSPADMAQEAANGGFETEYDGTVNEFFVSEAYNLGLDVYELDVTAEALTNALESGMPVICNVGPGDFTLYGHFFVITGINEDGTLTINDPFSSVNSSESWDMDLILSQTVALFAYSYDDDSSSSNDASSNAESQDDTNSDASENETTANEETVEAQV